MEEVSFPEAIAPLVLAVDVGTSSCRAGLFDRRGALLRPGCAYRRHSPTLTPEGGAEFDADALVERVAVCIDDALTAAGSAAGKLAVVAPTTFWHSLVGVDARGQAVTPVLIWMDARSHAMVAVLRERLDERAVHQRTGCVLHWSYLPAKLLWLHRARAAEAARVRWWLSFGEYLLLKLTGTLVPSLSLAAASGLMDQHRLDWDDEVLHAIDVSRERLPRLDGAGRTGPQPESVRISEPLRRRWPALAEVPWVAPLGDGACSNLGAGSTTRRHLTLMVGTSGALRASWRSDRVPTAPGLWTYRLDPSRVVMGGSLNDGGALLAWLRATLAPAPPEVLDAQADALEPDAHGLTVLPFWSGERSPGWSPNARGSIVGLTLRTTAAELYRAAMEAVALRFRAVDALLRPQVPEAERVVATGGGVLRSRAWLQILADALGRPLIASDQREASSRGAALWALEARGELPGGLDAQPGPSGVLFEPRPAFTERYRAALQRQQTLYSQLVQPGGTTFETHGAT